MPIMLKLPDVAVCKARGVVIAGSSMFYNLRVSLCDYIFYTEYSSGDIIGQNVRNLLASATHDLLGL